MSSKTIKVISLLFLVFWGCSESEEVSPQFDLEGQWIQYSQGVLGRRETLFDIRKDSTFTLSISKYGIYDDRGPEDLDVLTEYPGVLDVVENKVYFNVNEITRTIYVSEDAGTETVDFLYGTYFSKSTYEILDDTLYISYKYFSGDTT
ncbi:MAG: hypothetical protein ACI83B_000642 [Sediminicola sp.]|jgi:hypothetical protein